MSDNTEKMFPRLLHAFQDVDRFASIDRRLAEFELRLSRIEQHLNRPH
jgi:hypothetical protein